MTEQDRAYAQGARDQIEIRDGITDGYCDIINQTKKTTIGRVHLWNGTAQDLRDIFGPASRSPAVDDSAVVTKRLSEASAEIKALEKELSQARDQVEEVDAWLAKAADQLNITPIMQAMDLGNEITQWRFARQKHSSTERQDG